MTQHDRDAGTLSVARTLGDIPTNTTPADAQDIIWALTDQQTYNNSIQLLRALGWTEPAAA